MLLLCLATLLKAGRVFYNIISSAKKHTLTLTSPFPFCTPFIYFSCLIALSNISRIILNMSRENEHPCLVLYFSVSALSFRLFNIIPAKGLLYVVAFIMIYSFYSHFFRTFIMKICWIFVKSLFFICQDGPVISVLETIYVI